MDVLPCNLYSRRSKTTLVNLINTKNDQQGIFIDEPGLFKDVQEGQKPNKIDDFPKKSELWL